ARAIGPTPLSPWAYTPTLLLDRDGALQSRHVRPGVVMEAAAPRDGQVATRPRLAWVEEADLIERGAVRVFRVRIGFHIVRIRVVVNHRHLASQGDGERLRAHLVVLNHDRVRTGARRAAAARAGAVGAAAAAARRDERQRRGHRAAGEYGRHLRHAGRLSILSPGRWQARLMILAGTSQGSTTARAG